MKPEEIILEPVLTEKANNQREEGKYVFRVNPRANKLEVMDAVKKLFSVQPVSCNIVNIAGKPKRNRSRAGYTSAWKKAVVTVSKGEKITVFEGA